MSNLYSVRGLTLLLCITAAGCAINPATGQNQFMLVSEDQGIAMGRQADVAVVATIGLYPDDALQAYIQQLGERLAATSERPELPWTLVKWVVGPEHPGGGLERDR